MGLPKEQDDADKRRLRRLASTIWLTLLGLIVLVALHFFAFDAEYLASLDHIESHYWIPNHKAVPFAVFGLMVLVGLVIPVVGSGTIDLLGAGKDLTVRQIRRGVYALGVVAGVCIAFVIYYSGGMTDSPFTPLLVSYGFIAVVFARGRWTKGLFGLGPLVTFRLFYNQPYELANRLPPEMFNAGWGPVFATLVLLGTILLSFLMAGHRNQETSGPSQKS